ncbi:hypothetical protein [Aliikangiella maris]|uniref:Uncharacterized protein n=2 Tax=Aliikangiella maris TaxID=3162458 RepID=A0ABV2BPQ7_9GAMM
MQAPILRLIKYISWALLAACCLSSSAETLPNFDIVVFNLANNDDELSIEQPQLIAQSKAYENQPFFSTDDSQLYFTKSDGKQTDIWQWSFSQNRLQSLFNTEPSEYSPTVIPGLADSISMIRQDKDGTQKLWQFSNKKGFNLLFNSIEPIGYHAWSQNQVALFVLGEPSTLQITQRGNDGAVVIDKNIGRCLQKRPDFHQISYTVYHDDTKKHELKIYDFNTKSVSSIIELPSEAQDYTWLSKDVLLSSEREKLLVYRLNTNQKWVPVKNISQFKFNQISRLAVSNKKDKLAVVFENN